MTDLIACLPPYHIMWSSVYGELHPLSIHCFDTFVVHVHYCLETGPQTFGDSN